MNKTDSLILSWSGGKDSALALYALRQKGVEVKGLLTTCHGSTERVSMHGIRRDLLKEQADALGLPLTVVTIDDKGNEAYENTMEKQMRKLKKEGISSVAFGDIFLEDLKKYREVNMEKAGMEAVFPLWKKNTGRLMDYFLDREFRTITCCVSDQLGEKRVGAEVDGDFLENLPEGIDPCGENGEFHTFCYDGPVFRKKVPFEKGEKVYREFTIKTRDGGESKSGFWYCDLYHIP